MRKGWFAYKPGSVRRPSFTGTVTVIYLRPQLLAALSDLPEGRPIRAASREGAIEIASSLALCLILLRAGFT